MSIEPHITFWFHNSFIPHILTYHNPFTMATTEEIVVFTDGSCTKNGKSDAKGSSGVLFPNGEIEGGAFFLPFPSVRTNNIMEYYAAIKAMELVNEHDPSKKKVLHIYSDSMLLINTCTKWMNSWQRKGWVKSTPGEIKNLDLVKIMYNHCNDRTIKWTHVKAHQNDDSFETKWNNLVDKVAYEAVEMDDISNEIVEKKDHGTPKINAYFKKRKIG